MRVQEMEINEDEVVVWNMKEFTSNNSSFAKATRRRVFYEAIALVVVIMFFWSDLSEFITNWVKVAILIILAVYIVFGLAWYQKVKSISKGFVIYIDDHALLFKSQGKVREILYDNISSVDAKTDHNNIVEICLKTTFGQIIKLTGLRNMDDLFREISRQVEARK